MNQRLLALAQLEALLVGLLTKALGDESAARDVLDEAISASTLQLVPKDPRRVAIFAYAHLMPVVTVRAGARAALAMLDDLDAALKAGQGQSLRSTTPPPRNWQLPDEERALSSEEMPETRASTVFAPNESSLPPLPKTPAPAPQASSLPIPAKLPPSPTPVDSVSGAKADRFHVVVLEPRAFERAQIARHLLASECDVTACGSAEELVRDVHVTDAVVFDPSDVELRSLRLFVESIAPRPTLVVRSVLPKAELRERFATSGEAPLVVVARTASLRELVWAVRRAIAAQRNA